MENFSGLGSTFYVGLPGQSVEEMQEVKLQNSKQYFYKLDDIDTSGIAPSERKREYYPITFTIQSDPFEHSKFYRYLQQQQWSYNEYQKLLKEATFLMGLLSKGRGLSRIIRLRRHYNRWRRSYATRKTFYRPSFHKFMYAFMVEYVAMRTYHQEGK